MKKHLYFLLFTFCLVTTTFADSIRLKNNSTEKLRVIIEGADGSLLGEVTMGAQQSLNWTSTYDYKTNNRGARKPLEQGDMSKTPYTVSWYCMSGDPYSVCTEVAIGSLVMSDSCEGLRGCKSKKSGYPDHFKEEP